MNILLMMIPLALILSGSFLFAFMWATENGQFDDSVTPAHRMLNDEENNEKTENDDYASGGKIS